MTLYPSGVFWRTTMTRALPLIVLLLAGAALLAACGDDGERPASPSGNAADAAFIADMTVHHEGAIEMAGIARERAEHAEIRRLADAIIDAQQGEIETMGHIAEHVGDHGGHMGMSEAEMGMDMDPRLLRDAEPFDRAFIDMMVPHHEGAIAMARKLLEDGEHPNLRRMAQDIIDAQEKEIAQMRAWRERWYGAGVPDGSMPGHGHGG